MASLTIEVNDETGDIVGEVPGQLETLFKRIEADAKNTGHGEGVQKAAANAKAQIEEAIRLEKQRLEAMAPIEKQRLEQLEVDNHTLSTKLSESAQEAERQRKSLEEQRAKDIISTTEKIQRREERIKVLTRGEIRAEALRAGARDESLEELELILENYIGYDEDMEHFVKGPDGLPAKTQGKIVTLGAFVKDYLDKHPHHRKVATPGRRDPYGRAQSLANPSRVPTTDYDAARERVSNGDRSPQAIMELFEANRAQKRAAG